MVGIRSSRLENPSEVCAIDADATSDDQRGALARPEFQLQVCGVFLLLGEALALLEEASAILTHEDAEHLAHEMPLADVEQVCGSAIDFENRRVWRGDDRRVGYFVEEVPVFGLLIAQLRLQLFDPVAVFDDVFVCETEFLKGGAQFRECLT